MRKICKGEEPDEFKEWKRQYTIDKKVQPKYENLRGEPYHNLKETILKEQLGLCCYCCKSIATYNAHIEHFVPRSKDETLELDYQNLLVSCNGVKDSRENCGHRKDDWYHKYYLISPLWKDCESYFHYEVNGKLSPNPHNTRGKETIERLNLNSYLLQRGRKSAIFTSGIFEEEIDEKLLDKYIQAYETPRDNRLISFAPAILYVMYEMKENVKKRTKNT